MANRNYKTLNCPFCKSNDLLEIESYSRDLVYLCNDCKRTFVVKLKDVVESDILLEE